MPEIGFTWTVKLNKTLIFELEKRLIWKEPEFYFSLCPYIYNILYNSDCIQNSP